MPVTFPAHQGLIAGVKLRWPWAIDGTALCIAAAAPDLAYAMGRWLSRESHTLLGVLVWAVPFSLVATYITRWRAAAAIFAALPDLGPLRLRSYRVIGRRRPAPLVTLGSVCLGAGSHVLIDGFTHSGRWGADLVGLNGVVITVPVIGEMTSARVLQYLGHSVGSLLFLVILMVISSSGRLESWYGADEVAAARSMVFSRRKVGLFWAAVIGSSAALVVGPLDGLAAALFPAITAGVFSLLVVGAAFGVNVSAKAGHRPGVTRPVS